MIALFCLLLLGNFKDEVEGLRFTKLGHSVYHEGRVLLSFPSRSPGSGTVLVDLKDEKLVLIKDPRMKILLPYAIPADDGFYLLTRARFFQSMIYKVDLQGQYLDKDQLTGFDGWPEGYELENLSNEKTHTAILTFKKDASRLVTRVHFQKRRIEVLSKQTLSESYTYNFFADKGIFYRVTYETGEIVAFTDLNGKGQTIRGAREVYTPKKSKFSMFAKGNMPLLEVPMLTHEGWIIHWRQVYDESGEPIGQTIPRNLLLKEKNVQEQDQAILGRYGSHQLAFIWEDHFLELQRVQN